MKAIIVLFDGEFPTKSEIEAAIDRMPTVAHADIRTISDENVAKLLVRSIRAPKLSTEEGDNAVIVLAGLTDMRNSSKFLVDLFEGYMEHNDAIIHACSTLSQDNPVDKNVAKKYGFTSDKLSAIKRLHATYRHG